MTQINKKRAYTKPSMKVYPLTHRQQLLVGSGGEPKGYPGNFGYLPGHPTDENKSA